MRGRLDGLAMKSPEEIKRLREISARLEELGVPVKTITELNSWIDKQERMNRIEGCERAGLSQDTAPGG